MGEETLTVVFLGRPRDPIFEVFFKTPPCVLSSEIRFSSENDAGTEGSIFGMGPLPLFVPPFCALTEWRSHFGARGFWFGTPVS